jgi:hypothetical protein
LQSLTLEDPGAVGERMVAEDVALCDRQTQRSRTDAQELGRLGEIHPAFCLLPLVAMGGNALFAAQGSHAHARPAIAAPRAEAVAVKYTRDDGIRANRHESAHRIHDFLRGMSVALSPATARQA